MINTNTNTIKHYLYNPKTWYVRPLGGSYGTEDGTSYDNAFNGLSALTTGLLASGSPGDIVYICDTHTEALTIPVSGILGKPYIFRGDLPGHAGVIDSEDIRNTGILINNKNYITLQSLSSIDAVVDCLKVYGTSSNIITNSCTFTGSGNQGVQHENTASVTHNNITTSGNTDDGISGHDSSTIIINGGTISNNDQGINLIADSTCTVTGGVVFSGNITSDIWAANATTDESSWVDITGSTLPTDINATAGGKIITRNCTVSGTTRIANLAGTGFLYSYDTTFSGTVTIGADGEITTTDSVLTTTLTIAAGGVGIFNTTLIKTLGVINGDVTYNKSRIMDNTTYNGVVTASCSLFEGGTDHIINSEGVGDLTSIKYCIFYDMNTGDFGYAGRTGSLNGYLNNCTFIGTSNVGKGGFAQLDLTANNCIFVDLNVGFQQSSGTVVLDTCSFYNNTSDTVGTLTNSNARSGDPKIKDAANYDFSLDVGSDCIGTGKDLTATYEEGISTANWGNGTTESPVVTTKTQGSNWDIGAFIS